MTNRKMLTFGLAAGLVALVGTCLVAKEKQADAKFASFVMTGITKSNEELRRATDATRVFFPDLDDYAEFSKNLTRAFHTEAPTPPDALTDDMLFVD